MTEENIHRIGDQVVKESDLTPEQHNHKNHVISLRNKIAKLQFEIDDLVPSLQWHENALIETTKKEAENLSSEEKASVKES